MGRSAWKRKKKELKQLQKAKEADAGGVETTIPTTKDENRGFSPRDMKLLRKYLEEYRDGCLSLYYNGSLVNVGGNGFSNGDNPIEIGKCTFPILTEEIMRQPYMALSEELSKKQRRMIHEVCSEVGLFHSGAGDFRHRRYVALSVFADGLSYVPDLSNRLAFDATGFKPWACRRQSQQQTMNGNGCMNGNSNKNGNSNGTFDILGESSSTGSIEEITKHAKNRIYELIDQPGMCLREGIDTIDFATIENDDLSETKPPCQHKKEEWMLVDTPPKMLQCVQEIKDTKPTEIAFDLECYNQSKYMQITCLLQLALSDGKEYVIDPLAPGVWDEISGLRPFFADPSIVKIGHSLGGLDIRCLHRDFGIFVVNAFDTYEAAQCLQMKSKGLAKVCEAYGLPDSRAYESLKNVYQTTDWTQRPLTGPMIEYGRYDVHYLIKLRKLMIRDLAKRDLWDTVHKANQYAEAKAVASSLALMLKRFDEDDEVTDEEEEEETDIAIEDEHIEENGGERKSFYEPKELRMNLDLMQAISRSQDRCLDLWSKSPEPLNKNTQYQSILVRCERDGIPFTSNQILLYEQLADWREVVANKEEISAGFVCPLDLLASIAYKRPTSVASLKRLSYFLPKILQNGKTGYMQELFQMVTASLMADGLRVCRKDDDIPTYGSTPPRQWHGYDRIVIGASVCIAAAAITVVVVSLKRGR